MNIVFYVLRRNWNKRWIFTLLRMMKLDFLYPGNFCNADVRAVWHVTRCQRNPGWNLVRWTAPCGFARIFIGRQCVPSIGRHNIARTWRLGGSRVVPHSCFSFCDKPKFSVTWSIFATQIHLNYQLITYVNKIANSELFYAAILACYAKSIYKKNIYLWKLRFLSLHSTL